MKKCIRLVAVFLCIIAVPLHSLTSLQKQTSENTVTLYDWINYTNSSLYTHLSSKDIMHHIKQGATIVTYISYMNTSSIIHVFDIDTNTRIISYYDANNTVHTTHLSRLFINNQSIPGIIVREDKTKSILYRLAILDYDTFKELHRYSIWTEIPHRLDTANNISYSIHDWYARYIQYIFTNEFDIQIISFQEYQILVEYWKQKIPEDFMYAMIHESLTQNVDMEWIYSISKHESLGYTHFESLKKNFDGSVDHGIMGLNQANFDISTIAGINFLNKYYYYDATPEQFDYTNQLHILKVCVRYFKSLHDELGSYWNACLAYNGGSVRVKRGTVKQAVIQYASVIWKIRDTVHDRPILETMGVSKYDYELRIFISLSKVSNNGLTTAEFLLASYTPIWYLHDNSRVYNLECSLRELWCDRKRYLRVPGTLQEIWVSGGEFIGVYDEYMQYIILG